MILVGALVPVILATTQIQLIVYCVMHPLQIVLYVPHPPHALNVEIYLNSSNNFYNLLNSN